MSQTVFGGLCTGHGRYPRFATDVTTTGQQEALIVAASGSEVLSEPEASLGHFTVRLPAIPWEKVVWFQAIHNRSQFIPLLDFEMRDEQFDYSGDLASTETFTEDLCQVFSRLCDSLAVAPEPDPTRGTVTVPYTRDVIFSEQLELRVGDLPKWQPHITIDRRSVEANDE